MERQLLKSMCTNTPWSYVVFWKLNKQQHQMLLTYEDGYYDYPKLQESCQAISGGDYSRERDGTCHVFQTSLFDDHSIKNPNRLAVGDVSCPQYQLGEGLIGKVAASENDLWIYSDDIASMEFLSRLKYSDKWWLLPMTTGIKTTVLVPILPYGVLQLGSLEKVAKNLGAVADIKHRFISLTCAPHVVSFTSEENALLRSSTLMPYKDKDESSVASSHYKITEPENLKEIHINIIDKQKNFDQHVVPFNSTLQEDAPSVSPITNYHDISSLCLNPDVDSQGLNQHVIVETSNETVNMWKFSGQEEGYYDDRISRESISGVCSYLLPELTAAKNDYETGLDNLGISEWFDKGGDREQLLEAVVTSVCYNIDDNITSKSTSSRSPLSSFDTLALPTMYENTYVHGESAMPSWEPITSSEFPTSPSSFESSVSAIVEEEWQVTRAYELSNESVDVPELNNLEVIESNHTQGQSELIPSGEKNDRHQQISYEVFARDLSPLELKPTDWFDRPDHEQLLEAVISSLYVNSDDSLSSWSSSSRSSLTSLEESSSYVEISFGKSSLATKNDTASIYGEFPMLSWKHDFVDFSSSSFNDHVSAIVEEKQPVKSDYDKLCKYEAKAESAQRQKPRDEFLIQDQLKESSELVNAENVQRPSRWFEKQSDQEQLLESVITSLYNNSDDTISKSSLTSLEESSSSVMQISFDAPGMDKNVSVDNEFASISWDPTTYAEIFASPSSFDRLVSAIAEHEQPTKCGTFGLSNKTTKMQTLRRPEARSKNVHKQRPRDRQLIQDRLKELREIVPNSEKCSIDGVLDQTLKHMMFLKSVTEQAGKVKKYTNKLMPYGTMKDTSIHSCGSRGGLEVEDNHGPCPVIVKDLDHPGQLLIQMLCNNDEVFYEMAEVMYELKLTILTGVMESCCNNWALFIVQATNGFNRLDIFWPLMRILQRNGSWTMNQLCP